MFTFDDEVAWLFRYPALVKGRALLKEMDLFFVLLFSVSLQGF